MIASTANPRALSSARGLDAGIYNTDRNGREADMLESFIES
jgi:hypothetical protein